MKLSTTGPAALAALSLLASGLCASAAPTVAAVAGPPPPPAEVEGIDLVVKLDQSSGHTIQDVAEAYPVAFERPLLGSRGIYVVRPTDPATAGDEGRVKKLADRIGKAWWIRYAEPDYPTELADTRYHSWPSGVPEDAGRQAGPFRTQPLTQRLLLDAVHLISRGAGSTVAVLDTGVQLDHPALAGRLAAGYDFLDDDADPTEVRQHLDGNGNGVVDEAFGHGTFVAGMVPLVAPDARIMPMRVLDSDGAGSVFLVAQAIVEAIDLGVRRDQHQPRHPAPAQVEAGRGRHQVRR